MNIENIIVVPKLSGLEYDMRKYCLTQEEVVAKYRKSGIPEDKIKRKLDSHERQKGALSVLEGFFGRKHIVPREKYNREIASRADLIVAFGGDDNLKAVSHYADDTPLMGINSDPETSVGALEYFTADNFKRIVKNLEEDNYRIEYWTKLEAEINGQPAADATSEYFLGEYARKEMSHHELELGNKKEMQHGSGLLVVTGAGSTGWCKSAGRYLYKNGNIFPRAAKTARFLLTEPYGDLSNYSMLEGELKEGDELIVYSLNDSNGILTSDSVDGDELAFEKGAKAVIRISDKPLRVVNMNT